MNKFLLALGLTFFLNQSATQAQCNPAAAEIPKNGFDEDCDGLDDLFFVLPPYIYGVEGQDLEIYFRNLILSKHPQDYQFSVATPLGGSSDFQKWQLLPPQNSAGEHPISISVKSGSGQILATASSILRISPDDAPADLQPKKMLLFGHSFFDQGYMPKYIWDLLQKPGNPPVSFHGKKVSWANDNARHEGYGGMMARWFFRDGGSPVLYGGKVDFRQYFDQTICPGCAPDWIVFHLDINDFCGYSALAGATLQEIDDSIIGDWNRHATRLVEMMQANAPNAKLAICISPPPNARESSFDATYGGNPVLNNRWRWQKIINRLIFKNIERYGNRENQNIFLNPEYLDIDDFGEYNPPDARHPDPPDNNINTHCGYNEIAKTIYATLRWWEHHPNASQPVPQNAFRDADGDGFGNPNDVILATPIPPGRVAQAGDCDDSNAARNPAAPEICNDFDDNCNSVADEENVPPVARCKPNFELKILTGNSAVLTAADLDDGSFDACNEITYSIDKQTFECSEAGKTEEVVLTVRDIFQNFSTCKTSVKISENVAPIALCKSAQWLELPPSGVLPIYDWQVNDGSWDACSPTISVKIDRSELTCSDIGQSQIVLTATDAAGNFSTCSTQIFLTEKNAPTAECKPSISLELPPTGSLPIYNWQINDGSWDGCGIANLKIDREFLTCSDIGQSQISMTATDAAGNSSICTTQVFLSEKNAPIARCKTDLLLPLDADGLAKISADLLDAGSSDDCGAVSLDVFPKSFDCQNLGKNSIKLAVADAQGNLAECWSEVEITDFIAPNLPPPASQHLDILLDATGERTFDVAQNFVAASDNCQNFEWQISPDGQVFQKSEQLIFFCGDAAQPQPRTFWVRLVDPSGNQSLARKLDFWVSDNTPPALVCREIEVVLPVGGELVLSRQDLVASAADACSAVEFLPFNDLKINCLDAEKTLVADIFAKDAAGNLVTCQAKIEVAPAADTDGDGTDDCSDECPMNPTTDKFFELFKDEDGDKFGAGEAIKTCSLGGDLSKFDNDCDDTNSNIFPNAPEILNGLDDDCDTEIDEGLISTKQPDGDDFPKIWLTPNPTNGFLRLSWSRVGEFFVEKTEVFTPHGQPIFEKTAAQLSADQQELDVSELPPGVYFLRIKFQTGGVGVRSFVKI